MDIFVISLQRSGDRKLFFDANNSKYITKYTYWNAVDGKTLDINKLDQNIFTKNSKNYSQGAVGCALSHLQLWEKCIELKRPIVIMEDDVIVNYNFTNHLNNLMNNMLPEDWDIVQLSYNFDSVLSYNNTVYEQCNCIFNKKSVTRSDISNFVSSKINTTIAKLNHSFGTAAYIISPKGAKILKERCFPLNNKIVNIPFLNNIMCFTIDCMMNAVYKDISAYVSVIPFVMTPHISEEFKSTIE